MEQPGDSFVDSLLVKFAPLFTAPSFANFTVLVTGWALCVGRHSLSRILQFGAGRWDKHHSVLYRFLGRARWAVDELSGVLVKLILPLLGTGDIYLTVDDTLARRSGPHLWGGGMHHDPLNSNYGRGQLSRTVTFAFGQNWVIASLWVSLPWDRQRGLALPVACRLYRPKKRCSSDEYRKRTELAVDLLKLVASLLPDDRRLVVLGDTEYTCRTVMRNAPANCVFVGPMGMNAAFYALPKSKSGRGRPAKKGPRLPSPKQLAQDGSVPWQRRTIRFYRHPAVEILFKTQVGLWYQVSGTKVVRMVVTRDPKGRMEDRAYVTTDPEMDITDVAATYSKRWAQEVMHANVKQHIGAEDPQNGFWRRRQTDPIPTGKIAGPQPHEHRGRRAALTTFPCALLVYTLVVLWYFGNGNPSQDVQRVRLLAPWYRHKTEPSFADMLAALRRHLWATRLATRISDDTAETAAPSKITDTAAFAMPGLIDLLAAVG